MIADEPIRPATVVRNDVDFVNYKPALYHCPVHGDHEQTLHFYSPPYPVESVWCLHCVIDTMRAFGVKQVTKVERSDGKEQT